MRSDDKNLQKGGYPTRPNFRKLGVPYFGVLIIGILLYLGPGSVKRLGAPVVPFYPFSFWVPSLKPNSRKKGTLILKGPLGNLDKREVMAMVV